MHKIILNISLLPFLTQTQIHVVYIISLSFLKISFAWTSSSTHIHIEYFTVAIYLFIVLKGNIEPITL